MLTGPVDQIKIPRRKALVSLCAASGIPLSGSLSPHTMRVGVYDGSGPQAVNQGIQFDQWIGGNLEVQNIFIPWDDAGFEIGQLFNQTVPRLWASGYEPMLTWELYLTSGPTPDDILSRVAAGEYDSYIKEWAHRLKQAAIKSPVNIPIIYLRLGHEMNGDWYPWAPAGGNGTPQEFIKMWRHVWRIIEEQTGNEIRIKWVWAANNIDVGEFSMEELYPGEKYVDWLGLDGYNWGDSRSSSEWQSPQEIFQQPIQRLKELSNRPLAVTEFGSTSLTNNGPDTQQKSEWIIRAFDTLADLGVSMCIWFNENKETDWPVFDGQRGDELVTIDGRRYQTYAAFRNTVKKYS